MRVGDDGAVHRKPRIDVEIARGAVESVVSELENDFSIGCLIGRRHARHFHRGPDSTIVADAEDRRTLPFRAVLEAVLDPAFPLEPLVHLAIVPAIGYAFGLQFCRKIVKGICPGCQFECLDCCAVRSAVNMEGGVIRFIAGGVQFGTWEQNISMWFRGRAAPDTLELGSLRLRRRRRGTVL